MDPNDYTGYPQAWVNVIEAMTERRMGKWVTSAAVPNTSGDVSHWDQRGAVTKGEAAEEARQKTVPQDESPEELELSRLRSELCILRRRMEALERANRTLVKDRKQEQANTRNALLRAERAEAALREEQAKVRGRENSIVNLTMEVQDLKRERDALLARPQPTGTRKLNLGTSAGDGV